MTLAICGLGTAVPSSAIPQETAAQVARAICCRDEDQASALAALYRHSGVRRRHMIFADGVVDDVLHGTRLSGSAFLPVGPGDERGPGTADRMRAYEAHALPLAVEASAKALNESELPADLLTHLVTVSCTGFVAPGVDIGLIKELGMRPSVERVHVGFMGCHGVVNGLRVAAALAASDPKAAVLLCAVELCSLHYFYGWDPKRAVANALFADGAAAAVGTAGAACAGAWRVAGTSSCLFPDTEEALTWRLGDHGFVMTLSARVPGMIRQHLPGWLEAWLQSKGLSTMEVATWVVHPGGPRVLAAVAESLDLDSEALAVSEAVLAECGNMSSPTVLFILDRLRRNGARPPCVLLAFGPGLVAEAALLWA